MRNTICLVVFALCLFGVGNAYPSVDNPVNGDSLDQEDGKPSFFFFFFPPETCL